MARTPESIAQNENNTREAKKKYWDRVLGSKRDLGQDSNFGKSLDYIVKHTPVKQIRSVGNDINNWASDWIPPHVEGTLGIAGGLLGGYTLATAGASLLAGPLGIIPAIAGAILGYGTGSYLTKELYTDITHPFEVGYKKRVRPFLDALTRPIQTIKDFYKKYSGLFAKHDSDKYKESKKALDERWKTTKDMVIHPYTPAVNSYGYADEWKKTSEDAKNASDAKKGPSDDFRRGYQSAIQEMMSQTQQRPA